jgi:hypothetical protein
MATRTVRLDDEAEATLKQIRDATGMPISEAFKKGLEALREKVGEKKRRTTWEAYREQDIGPGDPTLPPARDSRKAILEILKRKHRR